MPLNVHKMQDDDGVVRFELVGIVSRDDAGQADPVVAQAGPEAFGRSILFDLSKVAHVDSTGLEWLLACHSKCNEAGGTLVLHSIPPMTRELVEMMRLDLVLQIVDGEAEALALAGSDEGEEVAQ